MKEQKHTPGPWLIAGEDKSFVYALGPNGTNSFWACVQSAGPERIQNEEKAANSRLIAAAPDLLEALQLTLNAVCLAGWENDLSAQKAREAIAKATGG